MELRVLARDAQKTSKNSLKSAVIAVPAAGLGAPRK
jgi:hypothetical protein